MSTFKKSLEVLTELFGKDCQFALATAIENTPSVRIIDTYYEDGAFYIVTYAKSQKVIELSTNENVALCHNQYRFTGKATSLGHPLKEDNSNIRTKLIEAFKPWYFAHNNENDENMCYVKIEPDFGFFYKEGTGYKVNFKEESAESFPFDFEIVVE